MRFPIAKDFCLVLSDVKLSGNLRGATFSKTDKLEWKLLLERPLAQLALSGSALVLAFEISISVHAY